MKYILLLTLLWVPHLFAGEKSKYFFDSINFTFGNWFENFKAVQTDANGGKDNYEIAPYFSLGADYILKPKWLILPEVGWIVSREANSSKIKKNLFFVKTDIAYMPIQNLRLRAGTSLMILNISGQGGEETLPNGDGEDTYYIPSERRTALNQTLDLGIEYVFDRISIRGQSYIYAFTKSEERMITYSLSLTYLLPTKEF